MQSSHHSGNDITLQSAAADLLLSPSASSHRVQFYEDETYLVSAISEFLGAGLSVGQPLVVIATASRRHAIAQCLRSEGFELASAEAAGHLAMLDASDTLAAFMDGPKPDPARFQNALVPVIERAIGGRADVVVRMYGEMVDLLWKDGHTDGAIHLEELWNELGTRYPFSLLCAYAMGNFYRSADAPRLQQICHQHTHVTPTERYVRADEAKRLIEITVLEQRARALEAEIEHRKDLERRLRVTLAARRRAEDALRRSEHDLRSALEERQSLLEREQAARAQAERADRAKSQFLAMMSHELRTPLNAIGGHVQLIAMGVHGAISDAQRDALGRVARSQQHLLVLINDLLNLTRIEAGRVEYTLAAVPVLPLLDEIVSTLRPLLAGRQLSCELLADGASNLEVYADREKVHQIVLNLLTNAIKFTPAGGHVSIEAIPHPEQPGTTRITVSDTGVGIPPEQLESIFHPFVQLENRPASRQEGLGLGLAISRDLARGMGGDLVASSTLGVGSAFVLELPASSASATSQSLQAGPASA